MWVGRIVGFSGFSAWFVGGASHVKRLAVALVCCDRLHAWWLARSRLATLLSTLVARCLVGLKTL